MTTGPRGAGPVRRVRRGLPTTLLAVAVAALAGVPSAPSAHGAPGTARPGDPPAAALDHDARAPGPAAQAPGTATGGAGDAAAGPFVAPWPVDTGRAAVWEEAGTTSGTGARPLPGPDGDGLPAWTPSAPLPAAPAAGEHVAVVLGPHPDDETLSLGVWIADAAARGDRVIVVCLTDGRSTGAVTRISARLGHQVSRDEIARSRELELRDAATQLGVRPGDVYLAHLDDEAGPGGTRATQAEVAAVIDTFAARYPGATFATMSWTAEQHPDHLDAGLALRAAAAEGTVSAPVFAVSRLWWALPSPPATDVVPATPAARRRVVLAANAYGRWDPATHRLGVGWTSVRPQFTALLADPRDRVHG